MNAFSAEGRGRELAIERVSEGKRAKRPETRERAWCTTDPPTLLHIPRLGRTDVREGFGCTYCCNDCQYIYCIYRMQPGLHSHRPLVGSSTVQSVETVYNVLVHCFFRGT